MKFVERVERFLPSIGLMLLFAVGVIGEIRDLPRQSPDGALAFWTALLFGATFLLALGTVVLGFFGWKADRATAQNIAFQRDERDREILSTARSQRAYVSVAADDFEILRHVSDGAGEFTDQYRATIIISNTGRVPATMCELDIRVAAVSQQGSESEVVRDRSQTAKIGLIAPGGWVHHHHNVYTDYDRFRLQGQVLVQGEIRYLDGFQLEERRTRFSYSYNTDDASWSNDSMRATFPRSMATRVGLENGGD